MQKKEIATVEGMVLIKKGNFYRKFIDIIKKDKHLLIFILPGLIYYIVFHYFPMYGVLMAFKKFNVNLGIWGSPWVGLKYFKMFFEGFDSWKVIRNTFLISLYDLIWSFPAPIIFALLLNELKNGLFKKLTQTVSYLPHFISTVVVCGMLYTFLQPETGIVNLILKDLFGMEPIAFLFEKDWFRTIFISMNVWKGFGWGSIIYLAALAGISAELYEAATIDGANRLQKIIHVTIPGIMPVIIILLIIRLGQVLNVGHESILLLYTPVTYETADVISTYVYRRGLLEINYSYGAAIGLFQSVVSLILVAAANTLSRKVSHTGLW